MRTNHIDGGAEFVTSDKLCSLHGFSTRVGGVSKLPHTSSLNLAFGRGDDRDTVLDNLRIFAESVGFDAERIVSVSQIHSAEVRYVDEKNAGQGYFCDEEFQCDGYVTDVGGIVLGVKTADCVPILFEGYGRDGKLCAVGAAHAGWRGSVGGIAVKCLEALLKLGALIDSVRVAIGPSICGECFEVRRDFYETVVDMRGKDFADKFVIPDGNRDGVWHCDLKEMNRALLISAGVLTENIDVSDECSCCLPNRYFSHRYSRGERGTMLSVIEMPRI